jgi:radical SAM superfamily enzyme YgiQ (UPF0313 family)
VAAGKEHEMKVCLLNPPTFGEKIPNRLFGCSYAPYPLEPYMYMLYAEQLRKEGHAAKIKDVPVEKNDEGFFRDWLRGDDSDVYVIFGLIISLKMDTKAIQIIREIKPDSKLVLVGPQPTYDPDYYLEIGVDYILRGEPEFTLADLVGRIENGENYKDIPGISYLEGGEVHNVTKKDIIEDLDTLPFASRDLIDKESYYNPKLEKNPTAVLMTSRGCTGKCYYCVPCAIAYAREIEYKKEFGKKPPVTIRSAENVIEEFKLLKEEGYKSVTIIDDQFLWGKKRTLEICEGIKDIGLEFGILGRADRIDDEIAKALGDAKCRFVDIGVESFDQGILDYVGKGLDVATIEKSVRTLKKYGVEPKLNILLGSCPLETKETIENTIKSAKKTDVEYVMFQIASPFPATEMWDKAKEEGWFVKDVSEVDAVHSSIISYPHLSAQELEKYVKYAYRSFYLRPKYLLKRLLKKRSLKGIVDDIKTAREIL